MTTRKQPNRAPVRSPLQTVDRALQVLTSFSERRTDWGVSELADEFDLDKSAAQRLLAALAVRGFLRVDPYTRRYSLGPTMWRMAALWERTGGLASMADPVLARLAQDTDLTAVFAIPDGVHVRAIAAVDGGGGPLRSHPLVGELYPAHAGATAKAYFAFLNPSERRVLLHGRPLARFTDRTEIDEAALDHSFEETARAGYARSDGEYDSTVRALAAPVMLGKRPVGTVTLADSIVEHPTASLEPHVPRLIEACQEFADQLSAHIQPSAGRARPRGPRP